MQRELVKGGAIHPEERRQSQRRVVEMERILGAILVVDARQIVRQDGKLHPPQLAGSRGAEDFICRSDLVLPIVCREAWPTGSAVKPLPESRGDDIGILPRRVVQ